MDREVLKIWTLENMRCRESDLKVVNLQSDDYQIYQKVKTAVRRQDVQ